jgi:hypothetical protein
MAMKKRTASTVPSAVDSKKARAGSAPDESIRDKNAQPKATKEIPADAKSKKSSEPKDDITTINDLQKRREAARASKNWGLSDSLRKKLQEMGVRVQDNKIAESASSSIKIRAAEEAKRDKRKAKKVRQRAARAAASKVNCLEPVDKYVVFSLCLCS